MSSKIINPSRRDHLGGSPVDTGKIAARVAARSRDVVRVRVVHVCVKFEVATSNFSTKFEIRVLFHRGPYMPKVPYYNFNGASAGHDE